MAQKPHILIFFLLSLISAQTTFVLCARDAATSPSLAEESSPAAEPAESTDESKSSVVPAKGLVIPDNRAGANEWWESAKKIIEDKKETEPDLIDAEKSPKIIKVSQNGDGDFKTIKEAVDSIEDKNTNRVIIKIAGGEYKEQIKIEGDNPYVSLIGDPANKPVITFDGDTQKTGLMDSATLAVEGDYFQGSNLIIKNTAQPKENGEKGGNGIALRVQGDAAHFEGCTFEAAMNTIRDDDGRHLFRDSQVKGNNDIIFGDGRSLYVYVDFDVTDATPDACITANEREDEKDNAGGGFVFVANRFNNDKPTVANPVYWGRPGAAGARVVVAFAECKPVEVIKPERWMSNAEHPEFDKTAFFAEYKNGEADLSKMVKFAKELDETEANEFITLDYIQATKWVIPMPEYADAAPAAAGQEEKKQK